MTVDKLISFLSHHILYSCEYFGLQNTKYCKIKCE